MIPLSINDLSFMSLAKGAGYMMGEPEVNTWYSNILITGGNVSVTTFRAVNNFVLACKNGGFWTKILDCGVFAGTNLAAASVKLVTYSGSDATLTNYQSATDALYSESEGFNPSGAYCLGTDVHLWSISTDGTDLHLSVYCKDGFDGRPMGVFRDWVWEKHYLVLDTVAVPGGPGWAWGDYKVFTNITGAGFRLAQRDVTGSAFHYYDGSPVSEFTNPNESEPSYYPCGVGAAVGSPDGTSSTSLSFSNFTSKKIQFYSIGTAMSDAEVSGFSDAVTTLQTALGRN